MKQSPQAQPADNLVRLSGIVERVTFHNAENGWSVLKVSPFNEPHKLVAVIIHQAKVFAGSSMEFYGTWSYHQKHGEQFKAERLLDYFYKTDTGTYRLPQSEEEQQIKTDGRSKGTHRRIKRYIAYLQQGIVIPDKERPNDSTLAEWIRHCKRLRSLRAGQAPLRKRWFKHQHSS